MVRNTLYILVLINTVGIHRKLRHLKLWWRWTFWKESKRGHSDSSLFLLAPLSFRKVSLGLALGKMSILKSAAFTQTQDHFVPFLLFWSQLWFYSCAQGYLSAIAFQVLAQEPFSLSCLWLFCKVLFHPRIFLWLRVSENMFHIYSYLQSPRWLFRHIPNFICFSYCSTFPTSMQKACHL